MSLIVLALCATWIFVVQVLFLALLVIQWLELRRLIDQTRKLEWHLRGRVSLVEVGLKEIKRGMGK